MPRTPERGSTSLTKATRWTADEWATVERLAAARKPPVSASEYLRALVAADERKARRRTAPVERGPGRR